MELQRFKHTLAVIILLSYLVLVNSTIGVSPKDDWYTTSVYQCIRQQGFQNSTTFVIHTEDGIDEDQYLPILNAMKNGGLSVSIIYMVLGYLDPLQQVKQFLQKIPRSIYDKVWIFPYAFLKDGSNTQRQKLGLSYFNKATPVQNCNVLNKIMQGFVAKNIPVGIYCDKQIWELSFKEKCNQMGEFNLFWSPQQPDGQPNFDDFKPFAGWKRPTIKSFEKNGASFKICGATLQRFYFE